MGLVRFSRREAAESVYASILEMDPEHPDALQRLAALKHFQREPEEALALAKTAGQVAGRCPGRSCPVGHGLPGRA